MFNDPSGEIFGIDDVIISGLIIGAMIGAASYTLGVLISTGSLRQWNVFDFGKSIIIGGISGVVTAGIGNMFEGSGVFANLKDTAKAFLQAGFHGVSQGFFSMIGSENGSGFFQGFVSGALGSLGASGWTAAIGKETASTLGGMIAFGALSGGIGAELSGGNFFKGFVQGGMVAALNHGLQHLKTKINWGANADQSSVSSKSLSIIDQAASASGNSSLTITSTARDPYNQARIMYGNCESDVKLQYRTYKDPGDKVVDVYVQGKKQGLSRAQIIKNMEKKINELGPTTVSKHIANPKFLNTFDISMPSLSNPKLFLQMLRNDSRVQLILIENSCYHIQIPQ